MLQNSEKHSNIKQPTLQNGAALRECVHWRKKYFVLHNFKRAVVACRWFTMWCLACRGNDGWSTRNSRRSKCQLILHQRILVFWDGSCLNFSCFNHAVSAIKDVAYALDLQHEELDKVDSMGSDKSWWWKIFPVGRSCRGLGRGVWQDWRERRRAGGHHYCIVYIYPNQKWQQMCSCLCVRHMTISFKS